MNENEHWKNDKDWKKMLSAGLQPEYPRDMITFGLKDPSTDDLSDSIRSRLRDKLMNENEH